jgi:hypothetical protein
LFTFLQSIFSFAQDYSSDPKNNFEFLPSSNLYEPVKANIIEARNGVLKAISINTLQLNIGTSSDIARWNSGNRSFALGADFFTYSNLRAESNFKFPVDAIDYFFGINTSYRNINKLGVFTSRFRISHISAHFEDGHKYNRSDTIFSPVIYSREFIDLSSGYDYWLGINLKMKNQLGINILFHSIPDNFGILSFQYGLEFRYFLNSIMSIYISNCLNFQRIKKSNTLNENFETGFRFGKLNSKGFSISFNYYDGKDYKGQYYDNFLNYKSIGFNVDL